MLPEWIGELTGLQRLVVEGKGPQDWEACPLKKLPESGAPRLQTLHLRECLQKD